MAEPLDLSRISRNSRNIKKKKYIRKPRYKSPKDE